jgi:hypothetical protein
VPLTIPDLSIRTGVDDPLRSDAYESCRSKDSVEVAVNGVSKSEDIMDVKCSTTQGRYPVDFDNWY